MKKITTILSLVFVMILMSACEKSSLEPTKVLVPFGAPAFAQVGMAYELSQSDHPDFEIEMVYGADLLAAAFNTQSHDIIYAPSNLGARLIKSAHVPYQYLATISRGNLYLATQNDTLNAASLDGKTIIAFGENATPGIVLETILAEMSFETPPSITYVDSVNTAAAYLAEDQSRIVLLAEPILSVQAMQLGTLNTMDLQTKWSNFFDRQAYPQAGVFVHEDLPQERIEAFETMLKESVELSQSSPQTIAEYAESLNYDLPKAVLIEAIPRSNLSYVPSDEAQADIIVYFEKILQINPNLIGGALPDETFYWHLKP